MGRVGGRLRRFGYEGGHLGGRNQFCSAVIKFDEVLWGSCWVQGNVHDGTKAKDGIVAGADFLNPSTRGTTFTDRGNNATM
jgi:hypothetical protein